VPITNDQLTKLGQNRKRNPPSYYNADTDQYISIQGDTEDALILLGGDVKQKAAQYLDLLLDANPSKTDYDTITERAASKQTANLTAALSELEPVISSFSTFKDNLLNNSSTERIFSDGMYPLLESLLVGMSRLRNKISTLKFEKKLSSHASSLYASGFSDEQRKEWRSWKRVLLAYP
jgi:hypothetical protein